MDDLGWSDLSCYGSTTHQTLEIDQLARDGFRFTNAYAAGSVCSPTRASLWTGRHPVQVNITDWIPGSDPKNQQLLGPTDRHQLPLEERTIGEIFRENGYRTMYAGKWHLGGDEFAPNLQGFDEYYDPHQAPEKGSPSRRSNLLERPVADAHPLGNQRPHATLELTDRGCEFIGRQASDARPLSPTDSGVAEDVTKDFSQPFLAVLSYFDVHTPIVANEYYRDLAIQNVKQFEGIEKRPIEERFGKTRPMQDNVEYATMVYTVDRSLEAIRSQLVATKQWENTIVVLLSDNGGLSTLKNVGPTSNLPLRAGKGWLYEGGIRIPLIVRIPRSLNGLFGRVCDSVVATYDLLPTLMELCNIADPSANSMYGESFACVFDDDAFERKEDLIFHYPHYHGSMWRPGSAIIADEWKLLVDYETENLELYHLARDPGEQKDLAELQPDIAKRLHTQLRTWLEKNHARFPIPNPDK